MSFVNVTPAYGRSYANLQQALHDWNANKDFQIQGTSTYMNKSDHEKFSPEYTVNLYFGNGRYERLV